MEESKSEEEEKKENHFDIDQPCNDKKKNKLCFNCIF
jgi:hypothetical protein